jgi:hypothetical protein
LETLGGPKLFVPDKRPLNQERNDRIEKSYDESGKEYIWKEEVYAESGDQKRGGFQSLQAVEKLGFRKATSISKLYFLV